MDKINFSKIEKKWQDKWEKEKIFEVSENSKKKKFYVLDMFPYPSGAGLHIGHAFVFSLGDIFTRFKRMQGYNVLYPPGYDSLGLPAENAAIEAGTHPEEYTKKAIANFMKQQKAMGWSYDWSRMLKTSDPEFYRWDQWIFLQMLKKGLAYRKKAPVNWCSKCNTVLANEQVVDGKCWRHENIEVEIKHLEQWFLKITDYAEELISGLDELDWPENAKKRQKNWIGKSYGYEIEFEIPNKKKVILVDAVDTFVIEGKGIFEEMHELLEEFPNRKIILTNADDNQAKTFGLNKMPYEIFSLKHKPDKINPEYFKKMLKHFNLSAEEVIYFEHNKDAVISAESVGIRSFHYDMNKKDLISLRKFIEENVSERWPIFTTRPDTLFGVTFMVISAQHPRLMELVTAEQKKEVEKFLKKIKSTSEKDLENLEKEGAFTGSYAINPATGEKVPVYTGNFVVADYGAGMVMAVPAHDQRDFEFAKKYKIPIKEVIKPFEYELNPEKMARAFTGEGELINSEEFNFSKNKEAVDKIGQKFGKKVVNYKLRDWLISRQRYWGTPIPVVYCDKCGVVPVPEKELPIKLPADVKFGEGNPLKTNESFVKAKCPKCGGAARRETDTMDTFANSSWYFLRYTDPKNDKKAFDEKKANYWCPIDQYIGGPEHITMHLIYIRFYTKFLRDIGLLKFGEPALRYFTQGIVHGTDGEKMSKSRGNVIEPLEMIDKFGADTLRLALVSFASPDKDSSWDEKIVVGSHKFLNKVYEFFESWKPGKSEARIESKLNKTLKEVENYIQNFKHNLAVIKIRELFENFADKEISKEDAEIFLKMLHVYCPFITEELWSRLGNEGFISLSDWPEFDEKKINEEFDKIDQAVEKTVSDILNILKIVTEGEKVYLYVLPHEAKFYSATEIARRVGKEVKVFAVNDKDKYDPQGKSSKAKPGKPAIFVE